MNITTKSNCVVKTEAPQPLAAFHSKQICCSPSLPFTANKFVVRKMSFCEFFRLLDIVFEGILASDKFSLSNLDHGNYRCIPELAKILLKKIYEKNL